MKRLLRHCFLYLITSGPLWLPCWAQGNEKTANDAALAFYNKGEMLRKARQFDKALLEYDYALAISDTLSIVHYAKGMTFMALKNNEKTIESLEKAVNMNKNMVPAYQGLIGIYSSMKDDTKLINTLERLVQAEKDPAKKQESQLRIAQIHIKKKDFKTALPITKEALALDKTNLEALYLDALVNNALGNYDAAKKSMESATSTLNSNDPKIIAKFYYELGFAYHKLKQFDKADAAFEKANFGPFRSQIAKLTPVYYFTLAGSYMRVYDFPTAQKMLQQALEIDKNYAAAYQLMAELTQKTDLFSPKVIDHYKKAIQHTSDLKEAVKLYETAIDLLLNAQKFTEAIALSDECLAKVNNARNVLFMKSTAQFKTGKVKEAITIMDHLVKDANLTPMEVVVYNFSLGMFHVHQKAYEKALPFLEAAKKGPFATIAQHELDNIAEFIEAPQQ